MPEAEPQLEDAPPPPVVRGRVARLQATATSVTERAQHEREQHPSVDAMFAIVDRDGEVGGDIMAGALAYRLFIWLLPLSLVGVAGLGIAAQASSTSPEDAAKSMGLAGLVSASVASSAKSSARWYALLVGIPILLIATRAMLRTVIAIHRLVWNDRRDHAPKPTPGGTLRMLLGLVLFLAIGVAADRLRGGSIIGGLLMTALLPILYGALWLGLSVWLPHRNAPWTDLIPGAIVFGCGVEILQAVTAFFLAPQVSSKQGTYGALGLAAALLLGLFFVSRLIVATAVVNATLWERAQPLPQPAAAPPPTR